jgi:hypothetical protein
MTWLPPSKGRGSMLTPSLKHELEIVTETALMLSEPDISIQKIAERIYDSEPALMEQIRRPLAIERLMWLMNRLRQHTPSQKQMVLPGFPNLPRRITLKNGKHPLLMASNMRKLQEYRDVLLKRGRARLTIIEKLIKFMAPYTAKDPGITVGEVKDAQNDMPS